MMDTRCKVQMMGGLRVERAEQVITRFQRSKAEALFAYLVYFRRRPHPREELAYLIWPESDAAKGRHSLSTSLNELNNQLELLGAARGTVLFADRAAVQCNPETVTTDVTAFEIALQSASRAESAAVRLRLLQQAVALYGGALLPGFYDDWVLTERIRLQTVYLEALCKIVAALEDAREPRHAIEYTQKIVYADPLHEEAREILIRLYSALGETDAARQQYRALARLLRKEDGTAPAPALWQGIAKSEKPNVQTAESAGKENECEESNPQDETQNPKSKIQNAAQPLTPNARVSRLPLRLTRFFGRHAEIATLRELLLADDIRLLTITGSGGNGKTRLATEAAERMLKEWNGCVWFIPLADVADPRLLAAAIRDALELPRETGQEPLEQIVAALKEKPALLVLDNFEHLLRETESPDAPLAGAALVHCLLMRLPKLTCLVTSRQILDISGEREFELLPLPTPAVSAQWSVVSGPSDAHDENEELCALYSTPDNLLQYPSVRMFADRAQSVKPQFTINESNAAAIATLCDKLEGIPLALELAAARAQVMTPAQMVRQLEAPFDFLASHRKDLAPRHQTLFKAIDWSYRLLCPPFQDFFARLSVFRGGWTLETAGIVANADKAADKSRDEALLPLDALDFLAQLRHYSLILAEEKGDAIRFRMLEMIRTFAQFQLSPQERQDLQRRHAQCFLQIAEDIEACLSGPRQVECLHRMEAEHENFRAALQWAVENNETEFALQFGGALGRFWNVRGHHQEAREWYGRILALPDAAKRTQRRARALRWAGYFEGFVDKGEPHVRRYRESLEIYRELGDSPGVIAMLGYLGNYSAMQNQHEEARKCFEEAVALGEQTGNMAFATAALTGLAQIAHTQARDFDSARSFLNQALAIAQAQGNTRNIAFTLQRLAAIETDFHKMRGLNEQALALFRELGDTLGIANSLSRLAGGSVQLGEFETACAQYAESIALSHHLQDKGNLTKALSGMAGTLYSLGKIEAALQSIEEALLIAQETNYYNVGGFLSGKARILLAKEARPEARACLREALEYPGAKDSPSIANSILLNSAEILLAENCPERAAVPLGKVAYYYDQTPRSYSPAVQRQYEPLVAQARAVLPEAEYDAAFAIGYAFSIEEAFAHALETLGSLPPA